MKKIYSFILLAIITLNAKAQWVQTGSIGGGAINCLSISGSNIFAGTVSGGVFLSTDKGANWNAMNNGLASTYVGAIHSYSTSIYAGGDGAFTSSDNGTNWSSFSTGLPTSALCGISAIREISSGYTLAGTSVCGVYKSSNLGTWAAFNTGLTASYVNCFLYKPFNQVLAGTDDGVFVSSITTANWTASNTGMPANTYINSIVKTTLGKYFAGGQGIFLSTNGGLNWTAVNTGLPANVIVRSLAIKDTIVFAATYYDGVFFSTNYGTSWTAMNAGLPANTPILTLALSDSSLYAGTDSSGVWKTSLYPPKAQICEVTVDTTSTKNIIYWDKTAYTNVKDYLVYRDTANNNYALIGTVPAIGAYSLFEDTVRHLYAANGDPNATSWRYKIAAKDIFGNIGQKSLWHQTVFFQDLGLGNFQWTQYQIEGQTVPVSRVTGYKFYRDNLGNNNWQSIQTLGASSTVYNDGNYALYPNGQWRVVAGWSLDCTPSLRNSSQVSTTRSNIKNRTTVGIANNAAIANQISITPNPAKEQVTISSSLTITSLQLFDLMGREVYFNVPVKQVNNITINVGTLPPAIYTLVAKGANFVVNKKLVIGQ